MGTVTHVIECNRLSTADLAARLDRQGTSKYAAVAELRNLLAGIACGSAPGRVRRRVNGITPTFGLGTANGGLLAVSVTQRGSATQLHKNQLQSRPESGPHALVELDNVIGQVMAGTVTGRITIAIDNAAGTYREFNFGTLGLAWEPGDTVAAEQALWLREQRVYTTAPRTASWTNKYASGWGNADTPGAGTSEPAFLADPRAPHGLSPFFDEADTNRYYEIVASLATQRPIHDGSEFAILLPFTGTKSADTTQVLFGNCAEAAVGLSIRHDTDSDMVLIKLHNGTSLIIDVSTLAGSAPEGVCNRLVFAKRDHASLDDYEVYLNGTRVLNGTASGAFAGAVDGQSNARIGARGGAISWYDTGFIHEVVAQKGTGAFARAADLVAYGEMFYG